MAMPKNRMNANIKKKQYYILVRATPGGLTKTERHLFPFANRQMQTPMKMPTRPASPSPRPRTTRSYPIAAKNSCCVRMAASEIAMMKIAYTKILRYRGDDIQEVLVPTVRGVSSNSTSYFHNPLLY